MGCAPAPPSRDADPPLNIVIIFADDLGYGDLGVYGHPTIKTPNIDRMAAEGQRWTQFYVAAPVCSPSRAALLTGRLPVRSGMYGTEERTRVLFPDSPHGMSSDEITLAEILRERGYATGVFGKWHLGHEPGYLPGDQGFDEWLGIPYSNDMDATTSYSIENFDEIQALFGEPEVTSWNVPLMENGEIMERPAEQTTITRRYTQRAVDFIDRNRARPFLLYVPHSMPHTPLFRSGAFAGKSEAGRYGDVIEEIDWSVGQILTKLQELDLDRHTLVVFTSDNGPWLPFRTHGGSAGLLNQGKGTTWEGGMRVPAIFWWPDTIARGPVTALGTTMDVFRTVVELTGGDVPEDRAIDGLDLSAVLRGTGVGPRDVVPFYRFDELYALRKGWFKAHFITEGSYEIGPKRTLHAPPLLYHLGEDPGEQFDVAEQYPEIVAELVAEAERFVGSTEVAPSVFDLRPPE